MIFIFYVVILGIVVVWLSEVRRPTDEGSYRWAIAVLLVGAGISGLAFLPGMGTIGAAQRNHFVATVPFAVLPATLAVCMVIKPLVWAARRHLQRSAKPASIVTSVASSWDAGQAPSAFWQSRLSWDSGLSTGRP